jgi:hypothetical protein
MGIACNALVPGRQPQPDRGGLPCLIMEACLAGPAGFPLDHILSPTRINPLRAMERSPGVARSAPCGPMVRDDTRIGGIRQESR